MAIYPAHSSIYRLTMLITTHCNLECPDCCFYIPQITNATHLSVATLKQVVASLHGIKEVGLSGGEPMLHPDIEEILANIKVWWPNKVRVRICTNAIFPESKLSALQHADILQVTMYGPRVYPGQFDNLEYRRRIVKFKQDNAANFFISWAPLPNKHKKLHPHGAMPCARSCSGLISSAHGLLYGCSVAPGVRGAIGVVPGPNWLTMLMSTELPCFNCRFGEGPTVEQRDAPAPWIDSARLVVG